MIIKKNTLALPFRKMKKAALFTAVLHKLAQIGSVQNTKKRMYLTKQIQIVILLHIYWVLGGVRSGDAGVRSVQQD